MFKIFWVSEKDEDVKPKEEEDDGELKVEVEEEEWPKEEEVGQVAMDVLETDNELMLISPIAWVELEDVDLSLNKTVLTVKGFRNKPKEFSSDWVRVRNTECYWWKFVRNVILPENLALNKIGAIMENNMLIITIPKVKYDTKNIKINKLED